MPLPRFSKNSEAAGTTTLLPQPPAFKGGRKTRPWLRASPDGKAAAGMSVQQQQVKRLKVRLCPRREVSRICDITFFSFSVKKGKERVRVMTNNRGSQGQRSQRGELVTGGFRVKEVDLVTEKWKWEGVINQARGPATAQPVVEGTVISPIHRSGLRDVLEQVRNDN